MGYLVTYESRATSETKFTQHIQWCATKSEAEGFYNAMLGDGFGPIIYRRQRLSRVVREVVEQE